MNKKTAIINIYNFIRMSHTEPSIFIQDDFDTIKNQLIFAKQSGFPATYALKYDALMEPRYQNLLLEYLDENDEISAWWEITGELCKKANVNFRGHTASEEYDDRVDSAYCLGYTLEERERLIDTYMKDFLSVFGKYPRTIGSWILDIHTINYAHKKYGIVGAAICRDQMATDGFTLWGGYPNGIYFPSKNNEYIPAQTSENQVDVPVFRLLGPDPIYNFESNMRSTIQGVTSLEPSCLTGRDKNWISWMFTRLTDEDTLGINYAQVGQENNFLWENIKPGYKPQLSYLKKMTKEKDIRIETMASTAEWFKKQYIKTPPATFQASFDWANDNLTAMWYASAGYRIGFLGENEKLRIRDLFIFDEKYKSRYLDKPLTDVASIFDALPVLSPQLWGFNEDTRPYIRLFDDNNCEPSGKTTYKAISDTKAIATLSDRDDNILAVFTMDTDKISLSSDYSLHFDYLPSYVLEDNKITLTHNNFEYSFIITCGNVEKTSDTSINITPENHEISIVLNPLAKGDFSVAEEIEPPKTIVGKSRPIPPQAPIATPADSVFACGTVRNIVLASETSGTIRYTLDGSEPSESSIEYKYPIMIKNDTVIKARLFADNGLISDVASFKYTFGLKNVKLISTTRLDVRVVFSGNGIKDLLNDERADCDYQSGKWRGSLNDIEVIGEFDEDTHISSIAMGFLSHHRSGIVYPDYVELFIGSNKDELELFDSIKLPCEPCKREIEKQDIGFNVDRIVGAFKIVAHRYKKMPNWCCYRGTENVFTMTDNIIIKP